MAAQELQVSGGEAVVKLRDPVRSALLDVVTLGVYGFFWYFYVNRELAALGRARGRVELGDSPGTSLLAILPGLLLIVPAVVSFRNTARRVQAARRLAGEQPTISAGLAAAILLFVFPLGIWYVQRELNTVWPGETDASAGHQAGASDGGPARQEEPSRLAS
jgi:hypothetical protein